MERHLRRTDDTDCRCRCYGCQHHCGAHWSVRRRALSWITCNTYDRTPIPGGISPYANAIRKRGWLAINLTAAAWSAIILCGLLRAWLAMWVVFGLYLLFIHAAHLYAGIFFTERRRRGGRQ